MSQLSPWYTCGGNGSHFVLSSIKWQLWHKGALFVPARELPENHAPQHVHRDNLNNLITPLIEKIRKEKMRTKKKRRQFVVHIHCCQSCIPVFTFFFFSCFFFVCLFVLLGAKQKVKMLILLCKTFGFLDDQLSNGTSVNTPRPSLCDVAEIYLCKSPWISRTSTHFLTPPTDNESVSC